MWHRLDRPQAPAPRVEAARPHDKVASHLSKACRRELTAPAHLAATLLRPALQPDERTSTVLSTNYGSLVAEDELLTHQVVDTFASVAQSDPSWTEKIWAMAHARDNSLQVVLGVGKYTNRGVFDGAAGVCRGNEQWTVRAGRRLASDPSSTDVGPVHYEVVEPLKSIRLRLEASEHAPIAFDVLLRENSRRRWKTRGRIAVLMATASHITCCATTKLALRRAGWT